MLMSCGQARSDVRTREVIQAVRVLMAAAEAAPLVKVGGLADVVGALPHALRASGLDVRTAIPHYALVDRSLGGRTRTLTDPLSDPLFDKLGVRVRLSVAEDAAGNVLYLIGTDRWFGDADASEQVYTSDPRAYIVFGKACALLACGADPGWTPDVLHSHDWHAGMAPVYAHLRARGPRPALVHTVHNMAYAGVFGAGIMEMACLPGELFTYDRLEFYGGFSFLKAGMVFSDVSNTVSRTYAREVEEPELGGGLAGLARYLRQAGRFFGITNGLDTEAFDPASDPTLPAAYDVHNRSGKRLCKAVLQRDLGLNEDPHAPVVGMVSRICEQKGHDLVAVVLDVLVLRGFQIAILGVGDPAMSQALQDAAARDRRRIAVRIGFDAYLANRIYAGSDMFLMPSRFEPCGLGQLIAMRYGSIPVVRRTGGLADTVSDADEDRHSGVGFVFESASPEGILDGLDRALRAYRDGERWQSIMQRAMEADHGWRRAVPEYVALYQRAIDRRELEVSRD